MVISAAYCTRGLCSALAERDYTALVAWGDGDESALEELVLWSMRRCRLAHRYPGPTELMRLHVETVAGGIPREKRRLLRLTLFTSTTIFGARFRSYAEIDEPNSHLSLKPSVNTTVTRLL